MNDELRSACGHPFLQGLSQEYFELMADCAMPVKLEEGEWVFHEGEPANRFYLIHSGLIELHAEGKDKHSMPLEALGKGDVLGWSWLFAPYYWHFGAKVVAPVKATFFYGTRLRETLEQHPALGYEIMQRVVQVLLKRLQATRKMLAETSPSGSARGA